MKIEMYYTKLGELLLNTFIIVVSVNEIFVFIKRRFLLDEKNYNLVCVVFIEYI